MEVFVTNKYGANVAQTGKTSDYRQDDEEWWQIARERGFYVSDVEYDESAAIYCISIGVRVDDVKGNFIGVIKAVVAAMEIIKEAEITTRKYETTEIKLITKDGRLVYTSKALKFLEDVSKKGFFKKIKGESGFFVAEEGGRERLFSYAHSKGYRNFEELQWILVLRHDVEEVLKPAFLLRNSIMASSLILITMGIIIAFFISRSISEPVTKLRVATIEIAKGNLDTQVDVESNDEIGQLATSFKKMTEELKKSRDELQQWGEEIEQRSQELADTNARLEEMSRHKSQFLANMSHELRTPLNSIIGFTGIILQGIVGKLNDEQKKQLNMVYDSAKHLLGLINDILDLSKIEAGKIEIMPSEFEVRGLIQTVEKMVSSMIEEKGLTLQVAISEDVPLMIYNDRNRIKQVLINLLSNATKFTESGKITVNLEFGSWISDLNVTDKSKMRRSEIRFSVADTGIGIKPEHLPDIFDEFKQIEGPLKEKPAGTGLGLAISKKIVEMMGGRIRAESEYGKGSCFQFAIPINEVTAAKRPSVISPEALDLSKKLVLTIDDEVEAQEILTTYLKSEGYEVIQAYNAMEAMELAKKYRLFAITLDIIMTGKDGWDILHELKKDPRTKDIPVICISILDNREMGLSLGAIEYMVKPINKVNGF